MSVDGYLRSVPSDADRDDGRLYDPTATDSAASHEIDPVAIASAAALGQPGLNATIGATGIASAEAFGAVGLNSTITPAGVASAEQAGSPSVGARIAPVGIVSAEQLGTVGLQGTIAPVSIASSAAPGAPGLNGTIAPDGIGSASAIGRPTLELPHQVLPVGIASNEAVGAPRVGAELIDQSVSGTFGSVSQQSRLQLRVVAPVLLMPEGIESAAEVGIPTIATGAARRWMARRNSDELLLLAA